MLVNGLLTNSEVWYGLTGTEVNRLEEVDKLLLRQIFQVASSCPTEALYLELGCVPLGIIIKGRRIKYLHHLVTREETEMLSNFFHTQWKYPSAKNEWTEQVKKDLIEFGIKEDIEWMKTKSKSSFKAIVKKKTNEFAAHTLKLVKETHSKMSNLTTVLSVINMKIASHAHQQVGSTTYNLASHLAGSIHYKKARNAQCTGWKHLL
jgi:hypothetical protein